MMETMQQEKEVFLKELVNFELGGISTLKLVDLSAEFSANWPPKDH